MPGVEEALGGQSQIENTLDAGIEQISAKQQVQFQKYTKFVLQQDGFVFWVATGQKMVATGSLHYATDRFQDEDQTIGANQVLLTSETEITEFNAVEPLSMWIGSWPLSDEQPALQVAFAQRGNYFQEADIWHYSGFAVYPVLQSQIINSPTDLPAGPIVSNSLPIWLAQNQMAPVYPSFLVPDNITPPYIVAHIEPEQTDTLAAAPYIGPWPGDVVPNSGASPLHQLGVTVLARDYVKLVLYGFNNQMAWTFCAGLYEISQNDPTFPGFANSPLPRDEKRTQVELATIAQKKAIYIVANYYQSAADAVARRLILSAMVSRISIIGGIVAEGSGDVATQPMTVDAIGEVFE